MFHMRNLKSLVQKPDWLDCPGKVKEAGKEVLVKGWFGQLNLSRFACVTKRKISHIV